MQVQVGNLVKSLDFGGIEDCYMIGEVVAIQDGALHCKTTKIVWQGEEESIEHGTKTFVTPMQGRMMMDDRYVRVSVIG